MIVLGIDPGLARLGYGVIEKTGNRATHVTHGCITSSRGDMSAGARLNRAACGTERPVSGIRSGVCSS